MAIKPVGFVAVPTAISPVVPAEGEALEELDGDKEAEGDIEAEGDSEALEELEGLSEAEGEREDEGESDGLALEEAEELGESELDGEKDAEELGLVEAEGDTERDSELEAEAEGETDDEMDADALADGDTEAEVAPGAVTTLPKRRIKTEPVTVNRVPVPTAPVPVLALKTICFTAWMDQSGLTTLAPLRFTCDAAICFPFCFCLLDFCLFYHKPSVIKQYLCYLSAYFPPTLTV